MVYYIPIENKLFTNKQHTSNIMSNITNKETINFTDYMQLLREGHDIGEIEESYPETEGFFFQVCLDDL